MNLRLILGIQNKGINQIGSKKGLFWALFYLHWAKAAIA
jgi:hypothetical protein